MPAGPVEVEFTSIREGWSIMAIVALVAAVLAPPLGVVLGIVALVKVRRTRLQGGGLAIAAIVVGAILFALTVLVVLARMSFTVEYTATTQTVDLWRPHGEIRQGGW